MKSVQLAAPGKDILTTALGNDYETRSGTSMAAPLVAGVAALALAAQPNLSVDQLRSLLLKSVDKAPGSAGKSRNRRTDQCRADGGDQVKQPLEFQLVLAELGEKLLTDAELIRVESLIRLKAFPVELRSSGTASQVRKASLPRSFISVNRDSAVLTCAEGGACLIIIVR